MKQKRADEKGKTPTMGVIWGIRVPHITKAKKNKELDDCFNCRKDDN
jgi:hypothetical protein